MLMMARFLTPQPGLVGSGVFPGAKDGMHRLPGLEGRDGFPGLTPQAEACR